MTFVRIHALLGAEIVMHASFYLMQECLRDIFKMGFTSAATFLNIWGGICRILPIFFLFLADTLFGNALILALSGIFSTAGLVLITTTTTPVYRCHQKREAECVGKTEKALFVMGMSLVALGKAASFASLRPFMKENIDEQPHNSSLEAFWMVLLVSMVLTAVVSFPYVKTWYIVFGVTTMYVAVATVFYLIGYSKYNKPGRKAEGSPLTVAFRVFVAAAFKISQPLPKDDNDTHLHVIANEEIRSLSSTSVLRFLHKAAIIVPGDKTGNGEVKKRSWKVCSVSEVEFTKSLIRMVPMWSTFIMTGVVTSVGDTYFVEQATHMNTNIGNWKAPIQLLQLIFMLIERGLGSADLYVGDGGMISSVVCCTVAAIVERRRLHLVRKHHLLGDAKVPMSAFLLIFQVALLGCFSGFSKYARRAFYMEEVRESIRSYGSCIGEGVVGFGFICSALSVYVVGTISEMGDGKNWFQGTLNKSRLDLYFWVLAACSSLNLIVFLLVACRKNIIAMNNLRVF